MVNLQPILFKVEFRVGVWGMAAAAGLHGYRFENVHLRIPGMYAGRAVTGFTLHIGHLWGSGDGEETAAGIPAIHPGNMAGKA